MRAGLITKAILLATPILWIIWDLCAYGFAGNPATESATLVRWIHEYPQLAFLVGVLVGHIVFNIREPIEWTEDLTKKDKNE